MCKHVWMNMIEQKQSAASQLNVELKSERLPYKVH